MRVFLWRRLAVVRIWNPYSLYRTQLLDRCWWLLLPSGYPAALELQLVVRVHLDVIDSVPPTSLTINLSPPSFSFLIRSRYDDWQTSSCFDGVLKSLEWKCWWRLSACPSDLRLSSVGVLFSVEVMSSHFALRNYFPCFFSVACGTLTFRLLSVWSGDMGNDQHSHSHIRCKLI